MSEFAVYPGLGGKRAVVTGGASGIGAAIAERLVRNHALVTIFDRAVDEGRALEARMGREHGPDALRFLPVDLTDERALADALEDAGRIDVLVNNAGDDDRHDFLTITPGYWRERLAVNLDHYAICAQAAARSMQGRGGAIVNISSITAYAGLSGLAAYTAAKGAIIGLSRALARELGPLGVRVTTVVPGAIRTPRQEAKWWNEEVRALILRSQCLPGLIEPDRVAAMVAFLASDEGAMCTGREYFVDAGWL